MPHTNVCSKWWYTLPLLSSHRKSITQQNQHETTADKSRQPLQIRKADSTWTDQMGLQAGHASMCHHTCPDILSKYCYQDPHLASSWEGVGGHTASKGYTCLTSDSLMCSAGRSRSGTLALWKYSEPHSLPSPDRTWKGRFLYTPHLVVTCPLTRQQFTASVSLPDAFRYINKPPGDLMNGSVLLLLKSIRIPLMGGAIPSH